MPRVKIDDVARAANVSTATVSYVINNTRFVDPEKRERVMQAVKALGYRPNPMAKRLASNRTHTVALLISDIGNPFYVDVIRGIEAVAHEKDYSVYLFNTNYQLERAKKSIESIIDLHADGALIMTSRLSEDLLRQLVDNDINVVVLENEAKVERIGTISINFEKGIRQAVEHLTNLGHYEIGYVSGSLDLWTARLRQDLFQKVLSEVGLEPVNPVQGNLKVDGGRAAFHELKDMGEMKRPTAVVTANDLTALGILWEAQRMEVKVPDKLSIIGLDNIPLVSEITPSLTTIALPSEDIGITAMTLLWEMIETVQQGLPIDYTADHWNPRKDTNLIVRDTTGKPYR